jgi:predicted AAA+ superfamily ATPase
MKERAYIQRRLLLDELLSDKSCFLFGPRQTGKSSFVNHQLVETPALVINLLNQAMYFDYSLNPGKLHQVIAGLKLKNALIVIDEIQRIPEMLNDVHLQIEENHNRFLLTGSSARKLKRLGTNLLGGRALPARRNCCRGRFSKHSLIQSLFRSCSML